MRIACPLSIVYRRVKSEILIGIYLFQYLYFIYTNADLPYHDASLSKIVLFQSGETSTVGTILSLAKNGIRTARLPEQKLGTIDLERTTQTYFNHEPPKSI